MSPLVPYRPVHETPRFRTEIFGLIKKTPRRPWVFLTRGRPDLVDLNARLVPVLLDFNAVNEPGLKLLLYVGPSLSLVVSVKDDDFDLKKEDFESAIWGASAASGQKASGPEDLEVYLFDHPVVPVVGSEECFPVNDGRGHDQGVAESEAPGQEVPFDIENGLGRDFLADVEDPGIPRTEGFSEEPELLLVSHALEKLRVCHDG